jgi:hypothetical protein
MKAMRKECCECVKPNEDEQDTKKRESFFGRPEVYGRPFDIDGRSLMNAAKG